MVELQAPLANLLHNSKKNDGTPVQWTDELHQAFILCKQSLADATSITYPDNNSPLHLCTDASSTAIGTTLYQVRSDSIQEPLGFYSL